MRAVDQVKTDFLLCVYDLNDAVNWRTLSEVGRLTKMAVLCKSQYEGPTHDDSACHPLGSEVEEWRNLWWCIHALDTTCNALT